MDHKKAAEILIKMAEKDKLSTEEKEAVLTAIGVLSWTSLSKSRIKSLKAKREKQEKFS